MTEEPTRQPHRTQRWVIVGAVGAAFLVLVGLLIYLVIQPSTDSTTASDEARPLQTTTTQRLGSEKQQLLSDIRTLKAQLLRGELVIDWPPVDPGQESGEIVGAYESATDMLGALEQQVQSPDPEVVIFLKDDVTAAGIQRLRAQITSFEGVAGITFISKEEAFARLKESLRDRPEILSTVSSAALPASFEVHVQDAAAGQRLAQALNGRAGVDETRYSSATSMDNLRTLFEHLQALARPSVPGQAPPRGETTTTVTSLPRAEAQRLDSLPAREVVREYFASGSLDVEYYLSAPPEQQQLRAPHAVLNREREGGIDDLVISGWAKSPGLQSYDRAEWPEELQFEVTYTSLKRNNIGEPPGERHFFVYVGRQGPDSPWKVLSVGTGP